MSISSIKIIKVLNKLKPLIRQKFDTILEEYNGLSTQYKIDQSPVTKLDIFISNLFKEHFLQEFPQLNFYSEEDQGSFSYPLCILDPVDGTKELVAGIPEWVVSFGIYQTDLIADVRNYSWIYNPVTGFEISSDTLICEGERNIGLQNHQGMVSRTEYKEGDYSYLKNKMDLIPVGSIAYKLALLASGQGGYVLSKRDKNVWDILAGTHICAANGLLCYQKNGQLLRIQKELYKADFLWCKKENTGALDFIIEK